MTREHKLALILGFAVVLIVGVLFADHFSKARTTKSDDQMALRAPDVGVDGRAAPVAVLPVNSAAQGTVLTSVPGPEAGGATANPLPPVFTPVSGPAPQSQPVTINNGEAVGGAGPAVPPGTRVRDGSAVGGGYVYAPVGPITKAAVKTETVPVPGFETEGGGITPGDSTNPGVPAKPVSAGVEQRYPVAAGDTLFKIARTAYGDSALWKKLAEYNKDKIKADGSNLRQGVTLRVPPKDVLLGLATLGAEPKPAGPTGAGTGGVVKRPEAAAGSARTYTIKAGDTFMKIAARELGAAKRWEEIAALNPGMESSDLRVGAKVKLPAK